MSTTMGSARPGAQAQNESVLLPFPQIVDRLREILGAKLVAYLGGVKETRAVREWAEQSREPADAVQQRLRTAYAAAVMLADRYDRSTVSSWFQGMNPQLDDVSPARALREQGNDQAGPRVVAAAKSFLAFG
jgi:hypothetical protein